MDKIEQRLKEFETLGKTGKTIYDFRPFLDMKLRADLKTELLFCISTANSSAIAGIKFQKFLESDYSVSEIEELMRKAGVRFSAKKAEYAVKALENFHVVERALKMKSRSAREYLVKNVKGLGYKEASHFLRNTGRKDVAILDRHILRWMCENGLIDSVALTPRRYRKLEAVLAEVAGEREIDLAKLDLILWFEKTGKVLK